MNSLAEAAEIAISFLHCDQMHDALWAYHQSLQDLKAMFNDDTNWKVQMYGPALDGLYPNWYVEDTNRDDQSEFWDITVFPQPLHKVLFIHKHIEVGTGNGGSGEENGNHGLVLHAISVPEHPGKVRLAFDQKEFAAREEDYGLAMEHACVVEELNGKHYRFLGSKSMEKKFLSKTPFFTVIAPKSYIRVPSSLNRLLNDDDVDMQIKSENISECLAALDMHMAFACPQWPACARQWSSQHCPWPSPEVAQRAQEKGVYLVREHRSKDDLWTYSFEEAEKELIASFTKKQRVCFTVAHEILYVLFKTWFMHLQYRHAFFWLLEDGNQEVWSKEGVLESVRYTLGKMQQFFATGKLPHYFIPQVDLFKAKKEKLSSAASMIQNLLDSDWEDVLQEFTGVLNKLDLKAEKVLPNQQRDIQNALTLRLEAKLKVSFGEQVRLSYLQYFGQLYYCASIDTAITKVSDHMKLISMSGRPNQISKPMKEILANILGSLHLAKAKSLKATQERDFFAQKAEEFYLQSHNMDLMCGKIKLANFFYMTSRWQDCLQLLQEAFEYTGQTSAPYTLQTDPGMSQEQRTRELLWLNWSNKNYMLPYTVVRYLEDNTLPSIVQKNVPLAGCPLLGISNAPVSYLDPDLYGRMLQVLALIKLEEYENAFDLLNTLENICEKEHEDTNQKRNCVYLNIVAHCFDELGVREMSTHNLCRSLAIMPNPRNPARWMRLGHQTENVRSTIKCGLGLAAMMGATAIVVALVRNKTP